VSKPIKIVSILLASLALVAGVAAFLLSRVDVKSRFEAVAAEATGLEVVVKGDMSIGLFPALHVTLKEVSLKNQESQIAAAGEADVGVELWPLLRKQVRINRLVLQNVTIELERDRTGRFNFSNPAKPAKAYRSMPAMSLGRVSLNKATFRYTNRQRDKEFKATDCKFESDDLQLAAGNSADFMKLLSLSAQVECAEMRNNLFVGSDVRLSVAGKNGILKFTPVTMRILDGKGSGNIDADFTGAIPAYRVHYEVAQLHVDNLFKTLAPSKVGEGFMDFSADLSMRGFNSVEMTRTAQGEASLRGQNLEIAMGDLDEKLSHYESSQNFNLIDVAAFFIVGPLGPVVTKGYNFASIFQGSKGNTHIRLLVSQWKVADGVAHAQDVAMASKENRLAMKGALDFVNREFDDVTVATLDSSGCARVTQKIRGPFSKPEVTKPNVLVSLTGPVSSLVSKAKKLMGAKCEVFYAGLIAP